MQTNFGHALEKTPRTLLVILFLVWKLLLLIIVLLVPGPGYDTSAQLLFKGFGVGDVPFSESQYVGHSASWSWAIRLERLIENLTRWDAIYFVPLAERGYTLEQEWAFGWGFTRLLSFLSKNLPITTNTRHDAVLHGIIIANVCHLFSVLILYQLVLAVLHNSKLEKPKYAFITATLHVIAPAGVFLLAPYTEAPFSFLNFLGQLLYVYTWVVPPQEYGLPHDVALVVSGVLFGLAATVRGNGLLSGLLFFVDAVIWFGSKIEKALGVRILNLGGLSRIVQAEMRAIDVRRIPATIIAGLCVGVGFATPQYLAYQEFCASDLKARRPWCRNYPPSIYSFVQEHYWNVGFLKYWTLSNAPLFLIASPVLYVMLSSAWRAVNGSTNISVTPLKGPTKGSTKSAPDQQEQRQIEALLFRLALPQLALASAALTSFHVQVITRLSSGYPLWYLVLAQDIMENRRIAKWLVRWNVMYAIIQTPLYAHFLPPA